MRDVVVVEATRSAFGKRAGALSATHPVDLLGPIVMETLRRAGLPAEAVGQVVGGCIDQVGAQAANVTRTAWLSYGGPVSVPASTVDSQCGSSQHAFNLAHALVASGNEDVVLACGVENMSLVPIGANARDGAEAGHGKPVTRRYWQHHEYTSQFEGAERIATKYGITRADTDAFGLESQKRARRAIEEGHFKTQIVPIDALVVDSEGVRSEQARVVDRDECPRETSLEALAALTPVAREDGIHTAGTSSQISDGSSAVLMMDKATAERFGCTPRARVVENCLVGCDPVLMLEGPIPGIERLMRRSGRVIGDVDLFEINEAFASVVLATAGQLDLSLDRVNPNGGAIALGHPLGATGCALVAKAVHELDRSDLETAVVAMCCGGGLGTGTLLQRA